MTRIGANDAHHTLAANDAAIFANATNGTANFHDSLFFFLCQKEHVLNHIPAKKAIEFLKKFFNGTNWPVIAPIFSITG